MPQQHGRGDRGPVTPLGVAQASHGLDVSVHCFTVSDKHAKPYEVLNNDISYSLQCFEASEQLFVPLETSHC